jgi:hypothetical protein
MQNMEIYKIWRYTRNEDIQNVKLYKKWRYTKCEAIQEMKIYKLWSYTEYEGPATRHWQTLSHTVVSSTSRLSGNRIHNFGCDRHWLHRLI